MYKITALLSEQKIYIKYKYTSRNCSGILKNTKKCSLYSTQKPNTFHFLDIKCITFYSVTVFFTVFQTKTWLKIKYITWKSAIFRVPKQSDLNSQDKSKVLLAFVFYKDEALKRWSGDVTSGTASECFWLFYELKK